MPRKSASDLYKSVQHTAGAEEASPHRLISILLQAALESVQHARALTQQRAFDEKARAVNKANDIISMLASSLNYEQGGEVAANLGALYDYCLRTLAAGSADLNTDKFTEVADILREILAGWQGIANPDRRP